MPSSRPRFGLASFKEKDSIEFSTESLDGFSDNLHSSCDVTACLVKP
jgi:hypothetical protein